MVSSSDRQAALRNKVAAQAARSRAANQERLQGFVVPEWIQSDDTSQSQHTALLSTDESTASETEQIECMVCNKVFKSENQYQSHEKSKKHLKAVQEIRRAMRQQDLDLDFEQAGQQTKTVASQPLAAAEVLRDGISNNQALNDYQPSQTGAGLNSDKMLNKEAQANPQHEVSSPTAPFWSKGNADRSSVQGPVVLTSCMDKNETEIPCIKIGKAKAKRDRKARQEETRAQATSVSIRILLQP